MADILAALVATAVEECAIPNCRSGGVRVRESEAGDAGDGRGRGCSSLGVAGDPIGFAPVSDKDRRAGRESLERLGCVVEDVLARTGLTEDELVEEVTRGWR